MKQALEALWTHRLRSFLTTLGIIIGVGAVIAVLTMTQSSSAYIQSLINNVGRIVYVGAGANFKGGISSGNTANSMTLRDVEALAQLPHVSAVSPILNVSESIVFNRYHASPRIEGTTSSLPGIQDLHLSQGSWFSPQDDSNGAMVVVIGEAVNQRLFVPGHTNPLEQQILIGTQTFRVVGVLASGGFSDDNVAYIPFKTAQERLKNSSNPDLIQVQVDDLNNVDGVARSITSLIRQLHHISHNQHDDFSVQPVLQFIRQGDQGNDILAFLLLGIATISLTVGGIGIMNIMLVSVTERRQEIGIHMALGARRRDIRRQFLTEALLLGLSGGLPGLGLGLLGGWILVSFLTSNGESAPYTITPLTIVLPFVVALVIALIFGLYPALHAARLDPVVALRSEE
jgi:putative ABC transport system permease protein